MLDYIQDWHLVLKCKSGEGLKEVILHEKAYERFAAEVLKDLPDRSSARYSLDKWFTIKILDDQIIVRRAHG